MTKLQANPRRRLGATALPLLLALAAVLAACSHHDEDNRTPPVASNPDPTPPVAATDAFITYVTQQVATQSDTAEPLSTDGIAATAPEDSEPVPLTGV